MASADGNDLANLAHPFRSVFRVQRFVPNGPATCKMNPAGREWFDIDDRVNGPIMVAPFIDTSDALDRMNLSPLHWH